MRARVLVTGGTGFVGRHLPQALCDRGFEVHALSRADHTVDRTVDVRWHTADLLDATATTAVVRRIQATHLVHLAWFVEHGSFWHAAENLDWVAASLHLFRRFGEAGGRRIVGAGTCAEYDWSGSCCSESTPLRPATLYGASKNALRELLHAYARADGVSAAWGRIFFAYGPGEQPGRIIAAAARALAAGTTLDCTSGSQIRDFLYVEDLAAAFAALLESDVVGDVDLGSGEGLALADVLRRLEAISGRHGLLRLGRTPERDEPRVIVAQSSRLRAEVGWQPSVTLDDGLARTLDWWSRMPEERLR